jgi:lactate dehydrogenase-like 2-hydroxyacid dehydrogenase
MPPSLSDGERRRVPINGHVDSQALIARHVNTPIELHRRQLALSGRRASDTSFTVGTLYADSRARQWAMSALRASGLRGALRHARAAPLPRALLERLTNLRCVVTTGAANRSIDLAAAAELTWGLILAVARSIPQEDRAVREGCWQVSAGTTLCGLTLGIIGLGGVGRYVARYARAFDAEALAMMKPSALDGRVRRLHRETAASCQLMR